MPRLPHEPELLALIDAESAYLHLIRCYLAAEAEKLKTVGMAQTTWEGYLQAQAKLQYNQTLSKEIAKGLREFWQKAKGKDK